MTYDIHLDSETDNTSKRHSNPTYPYRCPDLGYHFTPADHLMIKVACRRAAKYMSTYGQAPDQPLIDLKHYANSTPQQP
ncbi:MAG: hypothetical protein HDR82_09580 [Bacteroides sp.]|nr:hypothetical protein [Bacteroides sp.]